MAKNLGDILLEQGVIDREALNRALELQGRRLGEILIEENLADPISIAQALKFQARLTTGQGSPRDHKLPIQISELEGIVEKLSQVEKNLLSSSAAPLALASVASVRQHIETLLLVPVDSFFNPLQNLVTQLSATLDKQVSFETENLELLLDRSVLTELSNMAIHLIRNAIDHGIEDAPKRAEKGKSAIGKVSCALSLQSGQLVLKISDDGAGIDLEKVYERASEKGLTKKKRAEVAEPELLKFLFTPGFSTSLKASAISGRGVGLDVVEASAMRLGGTVDLKTHTSVGTSFTVRLPLTFAKFSVVPLRIQNLWVALPSTDILSVNLSSQQNERQGIRQSRELFGFPVLNSKITVTLKNGVVWGFDEVGTPEQAFVRGRTRFTQSFQGVAGEAKLANGDAALLLDLTSYPSFS